MIDEQREKQKVKRKIVESLSALSFTELDKTRHLEQLSTRATTLFVPGDAPGEMRVAMTNKFQTFFTTRFFDGNIYATVLELGSDYFKMEEKQKSDLMEQAQMIAVNGYLEKRPDLTGGRCSLEQAEIAEKIANEPTNKIQRGGESFSIVYFVDVKIQSLPNPSFVRSYAQPGASPFPSNRFVLRCFYSGKTKRFHFLEIK